MNLIRRAANNSDPRSLAIRLRQRRFQLFKRLLQDVPRPAKILDVGGTQQFWEMMGFVNEPDIHITLLNLYPVQTKYPNFTSVVGDGTDLKQFGDGEFDVVFSNSVIEHVGTFANQQRMAQEIQRVGKRYFVQTPNFYFPIEPHFLFPGFHWLPIKARVWLVTHFSLGWYRKMDDVTAAQRAVQSIRLLTKAEMRKLFPGAKIHCERFLLLGKSFIAYHWGDDSK